MALIRQTGKKLMGSAAILAVMVGFCGVGSMAHAQSQTPASSSDLPFTESQRGAMEDFVRNFILDNPEVLIESVNRMHEKEQQQKEKEAKGALDEHRQYLYEDKAVPEIGNPKGDITIIEFFDYNCGYCKRAYDVVNKTAENDKNIKIRLIEFPILSPQSETASKWALSASKQGKYWEFHQELMSSPAPKTEENLAEMGKKLGLDVEKLKKDAEGEDIAKELEKNKEVARAMGLSGTPAFIVGDEILRGFVEYEGFKAIIADQRKKAK
ncbi:MAG: hypothetical protein AUJ12_10120 [Alphaproteobacteria bacterium CG1_02_46_17]|nr:MAG: hypothetical protein AUJ12_10120 [Alphaproteobacteria bacterium CG1_02_46_17]